MINKSTMSNSIELRAALYGFSAFIAIVFVAPLLISIIASFGPQDWMYNYIGPALAYKSILIFFAGIAAGLIGKQSPSLNAAIIGLVGGILILFISGFSQTDNNYSLSITSLIIGVESFLLCVSGGLSVSIYKYIKTKL